MKRFRSLILLPVVFLLSACTFSLAEDIKPPPGSEMLPNLESQPDSISAPVFPLVPPDPNLGAPIYAEKCAPCHGSKGMGNGPSSTELSVPVAALGDPKLARSRTPTDWFNIVTNGNIERFMPPFSSLNDRQRWDVVAYAFSLSENSELLAEGESLYQANCADCHGVNGEGDGPKADGLSTPLSDLSGQEFMAVKSATDLVAAVRDGVGEAMPAYADQFSETQYWALAAYLRSLGYTRTENIAAADSDANDLAEDPETVTADPEAVAAEATQTAAAENPVGSVKVSILDNTGNLLAEELPVTLYAFDSMNFVYSTTLTTSSEGWSIFDNLEMPPGRAFLSSVEFDGVVYGSDIGTAENLDLPVELAITVYETTTDQSSLVVDRLHIFFDFSVPDAVQVVELYIMRNLGNQTIVGPEENGAVIDFHLPEEATNIQFEDGEIGVRYLLTEDGFADTRPIQPASEYQVVFAYNLPYQRKIEFNQRQDLSISSAIILVPEGIKVRGDNLEDSGVRDVQGASYLMYTIDSLPADKGISLEISGTPKSTSNTPNNQNSLLIGLGALGVAMVIAGLWLYRRDRSDNLMDEDLEDYLDDEAEFENADQIMDAIIALDDLYKAGELPEEAYQERRAMLKAHLEEALGEE